MAQVLERIVWTAALILAVIVFAMQAGGSWQGTATWGLVVLVVFGKLLDVVFES